jgi:hypothetical protein
MHHVISPVPFKIATVFEDIFPLSVFQAILLLTNVLVTVGIILVDILVLFFFGLDDADT